MSTSVKWIIGLIILALAAFFLWKGGLMGNSPAAPTTQDTSAAANTAANTAPAPTAPSTGLPTVQSDTSVAAMTQDAAAIDTQISGLSSDSSAVDQGLSDTPVPQGY